MEAAMFSTVIVGYDGSPQASDALALAQRLCERHGGELVLACAYPFEPLFDEELAMRERSQAAESQAEEVLAEPCAGLRETWLVETRVVPSTSIAHALTELAEEEAADLVVVGSTRRGRARHFGLGDVAMRLLHGAPCAVAIAPRGYRETGEIRHLGVAYDGSPEAEAALDATFRIARELRAAVTIYSVAAPSRFGPGMSAGESASGIDEQIYEYAYDRVTEAALRAPAPLNPATRVLRGSPAEAIRETAEGVVDLLVMGSRSYGPVRRALLGSVSAELVHESSVPVVVTPRSAARPRRPARLASSLA
jgi:nucleotide-binding universal stress UspA family protein